MMLAITPRQATILTHLAAGLVKKEIAEELGITTATVKFHLTVIRRRLCAKNAAHAVAIAVRKGVIA